MSKYNMDDKFNPELKLTYVELIDEMKNDKLDIADDYKQTLNKFFNSHRSGIVDQLMDGLGFDIKDLAGDNRREKYDMLRILKLLYVIEKNGMPFSGKFISNKYTSDSNQVTRKDFETYRIPILKALETPTYNNLNIGFLPNKSAKDAKSVLPPYGDVLEYLIDQVKVAINNNYKPIKRYRILRSNFSDDYRERNKDRFEFAIQKALFMSAPLDERIGSPKPSKADQLEEFYAENNVDWINCVSKFFYTMIKTLLKERKYNEYLSELEDYRSYFEGVVDKIGSNIKPRYLKSEGVLNSFFSLLMCHKNLCYDADVFYDSCESYDNFVVDENYIEYFNEFCELNKMISTGENTTSYLNELKLTDYPIEEIHLEEAIKILKDGAKRQSSWSTGKYLWNLITYRKGLDDRIKKRLPKELNNLKIIFSFCAQYHKNDMQNLDFKCFYNKFQGDDPVASLVDVVVIMQELLYSNRKDSVESRWYGNKAANKKTKSSIFGKGCDQAVIQNWNRSLITRFSINIGMGFSLKTINKIDRLFYRMKEIMYSTHTTQDIDLARSFFCSLVSVRSECNISVNNCLFITNEFIKTIDELSLLNRIVTLGKPSLEACRYITYCFNTKGYYTFLAELSVLIAKLTEDVVNSKSVTSKVSCLLPNIQRKMTKEFYEYFNSISHNHVNNIRVTKERAMWIDGSNDTLFHFNLNIIPYGEGLEKNYIIRCIYALGKQELLIYDGYPIFDIKKRDRLRENGFGNFVYDEEFVEALQKPIIHLEDLQS